MKSCTCDSLDLFKGGCLCGAVNAPKPCTEEGRWDDRSDAEKQRDASSGMKLPVAGCNCSDCFMAARSQEKAKFIAGEELEAGDMVKVTPSGIVFKAKNKACAYPDPFCECEQCN
jgi:hypothetical protein